MVLMSALYQTKLHSGQTRQTSQIRTGKECQHKLKTNKAYNEFR